MGRIRVLAQGLVNRIAAGECVERPASVVKELVENALDAGATRIDVQILDGGRELIQVSDDGHGMDADDLRLCITPHATSKIREDDDLFNIQTMGFRGEALPSIGSVARLKITSRSRDDDVGHAIEVDAGAVRGPTPCSAPLGTSVEVRDLFHIVPARRKFLKTNQTEVGHITEQFARIALPFAGVAFSLTHQKRAVYSLPAAETRIKRIADFFGRELADVLLPIRRESDLVLVEGFVSPPRECRRSNKWEYVFVNGRFVRDRFVSHAIKEAYRSLIQAGDYPVAFLFITIDPGQVDVNVHPTKIEVRWRDSNYIHGQVLAALRDKFLSTNLDHTLRTRPEQDAHREGVRQAMVDYFTGARRERSNAATQPSGLRIQEFEADAQRRAARDAEAIPDFAESANPGFSPRLPDRDPLLNRAVLREPGSTEPSPPYRDPQPPWQHLAPTISEDVQARAHASHGAHERSASAIESPNSVEAVRAIQLHNTYLVVESPDGVMIIDQHALHERILYEELRRRVALRPLESQRLLIPEIIPTAADRLEALETHADTLARLGIELTSAGPQSVAVQAFPSFLQRVDSAEFVRDLLDRLCEPGSRPAQDTLVHELLDIMACKAAVKAGDPLTAPEIAALLGRREVAERASHCPHGRPTTLHFTLRDLERQFKRK